MSSATPSSSSASPSPVEACRLEQSPSILKAGSQLTKILQREKDLKRIAGKLACAECRRLNMKCDKKVPCTSCLKRGCKAICPTGAIRPSPTDGNIVSEEDLEDKRRQLVSMSDRISTLEDALTIQCDGEHPLLYPLLTTHDSLSISAMEDAKAQLTRSGTRVASPTFFMREGKETRFLSSISAEVSPTSQSGQQQLTDSQNSHWMEVISRASRKHISAPKLPAELVQASFSFPFPPPYLYASRFICQLVSYLPSQRRALQLMEAYFVQPSWLVAPLGREQAAENLIPLLYPYGQPIDPNNFPEEHIHDLGLLYALLAGGIVLKSNDPALAAETDRYYHLAKAAMSLGNVFERGTMEACQALLLISNYAKEARGVLFQEAEWRMVGLALNIALSIGLHRDPIRWKLGRKEAERRRQLFWEINVLDKARCMFIGRPLVFVQDAVDCSFPIDTSCTVDSTGNTFESVRNWRYRAVRAFGYRACEAMSSANSVAYSEIVDLDREIRAFGYHPFFHSRGDEEHRLRSAGMLSGDIHPVLSFIWIEQNLQHLHCSYFFRAVKESDGFPDRSPMFHSFEIMILSTRKLLSIFEAVLTLYENDHDRAHPVWSAYLTCAITFSQITLQVKDRSHTLPAFQELERCIGFIECYLNHPIPKASHDILCHLRDMSSDVLFDDSDSNYRRVMKFSPDAEAIVLKQSMDVVSRRGSSIALDDPNVLPTAEQ